MRHLRANDPDQDSPIASMLAPHDDAVSSLATGWPNPGTVTRANGYDAAFGIASRCVPVSAVPRRIGSGWPW